MIGQAVAGWATRLVLLAFTLLVSSFLVYALMRDTKHASAMHRHE